ARPDDARWATARAAGPAPAVAFLFPGQGAQQPGVGDELYRRQPVFRRWIDAAREALGAAMEAHAFAALDPLLPGAAAPARDAAATERLAHTALAQPALFAFEHALAQVWIDFGVEPEAMAGHSVGEWVAATLAGVVSFADAARLVAERGRLMGDLPRGAMLAVPLAEERLAALLPEVSPELAVAAVNAPGLCAVAGPAAAVDALARRLAADGVETRRLTTSHAFHSPMVEPAVEPFRAAVAAVPLSPPRRRFVSSATGGWITPEEATDPGYWAGQVRRTVRFGPAVEALLAEPRRVLVEVGPGSSLTSLVRRHPAGRERVALPGLPRRAGDGGGEAEALLGAAARLWLAGVDLAHAALDADRPRRRVSLPGYPFAGPRYWIDRPGAGGEGEVGTATAKGRERGPSAISKLPDPGDWFYLPAWRSLPPVDLLLPPAEATEETAASWLLVGTGSGVAELLAARLAASGARVATAVGGERFEQIGDDRFTLRPGEPADAEALLAAVAAGGPPPRVVWLDPVAAPSAAAPEDPAGLAAALLVLARALSAAAGPEPCLLLAVSDGLWQVAGEPVRGPERAAADGLARVLPQELPGLACRWIDLPPAIGEAEIDLLAAELSASPSGGAGAPPRVALRGGRRWQEVWEPRPLPAPVARAGFRRGGRYLVTGGLGRFGVAVARRLAAEHDARVLLLDRREPDADLLAELVAAGGEIEPIAGDAADPAAVAAALARAADLWGGLDGVLHAAGRPATDFRPLADLGREELAAHLVPKLGGLAALRSGIERLAAERPEAA
ncbi:MAG TPA: SDR family NAD(P)-dependent oxidoreductase, partial [Thermoanaerobaculia bacterium]